MKNHALSQYIINICCLKGVAPQHYQDIIKTYYYFFLIEQKYENPGSEAPGVERQLLERLRYSTSISRKVALLQPPTTVVS